MGCFIHAAPSPCGVMARTKQRMPPVVVAAAPKFVVDGVTLTP